MWQKSWNGDKLGPVKLIGWLEQEQDNQGDQGDQGDQGNRRKQNDPGDVPQPHPVG